MPYFFEDEYALYGSDRVQSALQRWRPDAWTTFTSAADETFSQYNTIGWMTSVLPEWVAEDDTPIQRNEWNDNHPLYREGLNYTENLTEGVALARATESDRESRLQFTRQNVDFWSLPNLAGTFLGGLPDPVNLVGVGGFLGRMGTVAKVARKMPVVKYTAPVLQGSADTALAESLFQFTRASVAASKGEDLDQFAVLTEIGLATAFGGMFSALPMAWQIARKAPDIVHYNWLAQARNQVGREGDSVTVFGREGMNDEAIPTSDARRNNQETLDDLDEEIAETVGEEDQLFNEERRNFDDPIDDRSWSERAVDDMADAVTDPVGTFRNAYEKVANCMLRFSRKKF